MKKECDACEGKGWEERHIGGGNLRKYECKPCGGTGKVDAEEEEMTKEELVEFLDHTASVMCGWSFHAGFPAWTEADVAAYQEIRALIEQRPRVTREQLQYIASRVRGIGGYAETPISTLFKEAGIEVEEPK